MGSNTEHSGAQLAEPALLNKIDKLFACGVGEYIDLPQLVVVGDQSSGKSSVLEGLTKLPFPRSNNLCTRFATQIIFRRASEVRTIVSIIPAKNTGAERQEMLRDWRKVEPEKLNAERFATIMTEVYEIMGLSGAEGEKPRSSFSEDILRLEITGPEQEHLSVVDVPGIFRKVTEGVTTKEDMSMVKSMVKGYMSNHRSVMLTVVPANVDIATQDILTMAEEEDPDGIRTLGVLTKPDLVDDGAESSVIDLLEGRTHQLKLGWCIVKNSSQKDLADPGIDRDAREKDFFRSKAPWTRLDEDRVGITSLRIRLQEILADHIRREFPRVKSEIQKKLHSCQKELDGLGQSRGTTEEQREYLNDLCNRYQEVTTEAINLNYSSYEILESSPYMRLPTAIRNRNELFAIDMKSHGHRYTLDEAEFSDDMEADMKNPAPLTREFSKNGSRERTSSMAPVWHVGRNKYSDDVEIFSVGDRYVSKTLWTATLPWLKSTYQKARGFELGTFDKSLLASIMKKQSVKWEYLAKGYIDDIIRMVHTFINELLSELCPDKRVLSALTSKLLDNLILRYKSASEHVNFLLQIERNEIPITMNMEFANKLEANRAIKREKAYGEYADTAELDSEEEEATPTPKKRGNKNSTPTASKPAVSSTKFSPSSSFSSTSAYTSDNPALDASAAAAAAAANMEQTAKELLDILRAYYAVALNRFVDNVCMQASMHFLLKGVDESPLKLFSSKWVNRLTAEDLDEIAGEEPRVKQKRANLQKTIQNLSEGKKILR